MIKDIHHISLKCESKNQFDDVVRFYHEILGLTILRNWGEDEDSACMLSLGSGIIEVFAKGRASDATGSINHFALLSTNVVADLQKVREAGYKVTVEPKKVTPQITKSDGTKADYPLHVAFFVGPLGEEIEIFQEL